MFASKPLFKQLACYVCKLNYTDNANMNFNSGFVKPQTLNAQDLFLTQGKNKLNKWKTITHDSVIPKFRLAWVSHFISLFLNPNMYTNSKTHIILMRSKVPFQQERQYCCFLTAVHDLVNH